METIDLSKLTPEQKAQLVAGLEAEKKAENEKKSSEKVAYLKMKDNTVERVFARLVKISADLESTKKQMMEEFDTLRKMKEELYGMKEKQQSFNWSNEDYSVTIITGVNVIDRWDDTVSMGIGKVDEWMGKRINASTRDMVAMVRELLKPNKAGILKANRILDLSNYADKIGDKELIEAVSIIRQAYQPDISGTYIKAKYKDSEGKSQWLPLDMASISLDSEVVETEEIKEEQK